MIKSCYILAGGKSSRMGVDKGFVYFEGKSLIQHQIDLARSLKLEPIIVTNNSSYESLGVDCIEDKVKEIGPMGGIYTALHHSSKDRILVLSVDQIGLSINDVEKLLAEDTERFEASVLEDKNGIQPLVGIYSNSLINKLDSSIQEQKYSLVKFLNSTGYESIRVEEELFNINSPTEVDASLVEVKFFGMLEEAVGANSIFSLLKKEDYHNIENCIKKDFPPLEKFKYQVAVNRKMNGSIDPALKINEVSLFPAFAGG